MGLVERLLAGGVRVVVGLVMVVDRFLVGDVVVAGKLSVVRVALVVVMKRFVLAVVGVVCFWRMSQKSESMRI